jgi:polysaccharide deacetylase family protein (PEP-CTERM system associated)
MAPPVTITLDVEDLRPDQDLPERVVAMTGLVLDMLADSEVRASIFVVGELAERRPGIVQRAARDGHEIGLHSWSHVPIPTQRPEDFLADIERGRSLLQDLSGQQVTGYRAPMMSLVPASAWAVPLILEAGFTYSSSVLPGPSPLYGWPGLPRRPFRWSGGPIEFPCPMVRLGPIDLPYLGGTYLRLLPAAVRRIGLRRSAADEALWAYCHPWEFDTDEAFHPHDHIGTLASRIAWLGRSRMRRQLRRLLVEPVAPPLAEVAGNLAGCDLPVVDPNRPPELGSVARWANGRLRQR